MRMSIRPFTRLTNAFSKKIENHTAAVALHFMQYNFCALPTNARATGFGEGRGKIGPSLRFDRVLPQRYPDS
jgi:hypothetical protein